MDRAEANSTVAAMPSAGVPMNRVWTTIRDYILWSYERGTIQYDVMVSVILVFVFFSPYWINYKDKPVERNPHQIGVVVSPDGKGGIVYQIEAKAIDGKNEDAVRGQLLSVIEPISGEVSISTYEAVRDGSGKILAYKVWVQR